MNRWNCRRERFDQLDETEQKRSLKHYLAFCSYEDALFGRLLDVLERRNLLENTVVLYVSDHGDYAGAHGLWTKGLPCFKEAYHICSVMGYGGIKAEGAVIGHRVSLGRYPEGGRYSRKAEIFWIFPKTVSGRTYSGKLARGNLHTEQWKRVLWDPAEYFY